MKFCIDTSAWLDGWARDYPPDVFPSLWEKIDELIMDGTICSTEEVYIELKKKDDSLIEWMKTRKQVFTPIEEGIQEIVLELLSDHPRLVDTHRNRSQADPFVIATAEYMNAIVVTGETPRGKLDKPKIPDVCQHRGTKCISFLEMLRMVGWTF